MRIYLEPQDDGLPMRPSGPWAAEKLDYLARYVDAFETAMREKWTLRNYIDLLAGPGKARVRGTRTVLLGSPLLALTTTHPFTGYFFVDLLERNTQALAERCAASPLHGQVWIRAGDCNKLVHSVVAAIERVGGPSLNLAFLDPEGVKDLQWATVETLASVRRMDLIVHYPQYALNRGMRQAFQAQGPTAVDRFFGGREWRDIYQTYVRARLVGSLHRNLIDLYKSALAALGYQAWIGDEPLIRSVARGAPLYRLLFASKHPLGQKLWHSILQRDVYGQRRLFEEQLDYE